MMTPFPPKSSARRTCRGRSSTGEMQMRRERERPARPPGPPPGKVDPAHRPTLHCETGAEIDATIDWLAHVAAGRIEAQ